MRKFEIKEHLFLISSYTSISQEEVKFKFGHYK